MNGTEMSSESNGDMVETSIMPGIISEGKMIDTTVLPGVFSTDVMINTTTFNDSTTMIADALPKESSNLIDLKTGMHFKSMIFFFRTYVAVTCMSIFINLVACILCMFKSQIKLYFLRKYKTFFKRSNDNIRDSENQYDTVSQRNEIQDSESEDLTFTKFFENFKCKKNKYTGGEETPVKEVIKYTEDELFHNAVSKAYKAKK